jgi:protein-S-isoprenylcysteine O-methyltransferase Ste14
MADDSTSARKPAPAILLGSAGAHAPTPKTELAGSLEELSASETSARADARGSASNSSGRFLAKAFLSSLLFIILYSTAALCCLRQWGSDHPWSRLDIFSGGFLAVSLIWVYATMQFYRVIFRSHEVLSEAVGTTYDKLMLFWIGAFGVAEISVYMDYGHWHLIRALEQPVLQAIGLGIYLLSALWLIWTDRFLSRQFEGDLSKRKVLSDGPYRFVRHPRYAALIAARIAFALSLASILAWGFAIGWIWVNLERVRLEEAHLRELFGPDYERYAARTGRFFPMIPRRPRLRETY